jgi:hypothetical protein
MNWHFPNKNVLEEITATTELGELQSCNQLHAYLSPKELNNII